jgi:tetraacyldisaccharide 4'-kinase
MRLLRLLLLPFSLLYAIVLRVRHLAFDLGILRSSPGPLPTIVVGNLSLGGTGKTPFTVFLAERLRSRGKRIAILSRGYRRTTKGLRDAADGADAGLIGDEPALIHRLLPDVPLVVCEDRLTGLSALAQRSDAPELVVLDDAFQHRKLRATCNILLTTFQHPWWKDFLLPAGNLRDIPGAAARAKAVVVTKCPAGLSREQQQRMMQRIRPLPGQQVFFATLEYGAPYPLSGSAPAPGADSPVIGFCGIADPGLFRKHLEENFSLRYFRAFPDHHAFRSEDISALLPDLATFGGYSVTLMTTEKDAEKIRNLDLPKDVCIAVVPVRLKLLDREEEFDELLAQAKS